ncbi:saccharopine dehydrogenase family protein [Methylovirgula sp. 4M-Z18]|uniref:saccharopine dehydrogenase family protein n=1 Tax=Methylovirgula sp. 4M-Z18 TaxID=2293567 RepID=UPI000E2EB750|nr:saccharopine dehydrogenase family protein [Methylovirgula sp. 4M-Z18]RFB76287.1 saccharopine dehydrogenase family protein [Methylovirgula sp. 4M-Z18]
MREVVVVGTGKIGAAIVEMLSATGDYLVTAVDRAAPVPKILHHPDRVRFERIDILDRNEFDRILAGKFAVLSAAPYYFTSQIAAAAVANGVHYLDLTEDVATTKKVMQLAQESSHALVPQCGLAPGFVSIVGYDLARQFERLDSLRMRVGALPQYPSNALNYNLTWSTDGVINEYCEPCEAIVDGARTSVPALEEREEFSLDGVTYEAFNTSGGLGTLCDTLQGKVRTLNYRTIRYPGHAAIMKALLNDLRLRDRRDLLKDILENAVPVALQDVVIIFVTASGYRDGRLEQETYANKIYAQKLEGQTRTAIQATTASSICAVLDLLSAGKIPSRGFLRQEDISLDVFLDNRFGRVYRHRERPAMPPLDPTTATS